MTKTQKNKRKFVMPFKRMISDNGKNSLVYISKECMVELEQCQRIKKMITLDNNWYTINYDSPIELNLVEVEPDYYKVVSGGRIGEFLSHYKWNYDDKNVYTYMIVNGKKVTIERVSINYAKFGYFKNVNIDVAAHHKWFRFCALVETLKDTEKVEHLKNHMIIGNYDRGQCIEIISKTDFDYFLSVVEEATNLLQNRTFSIEF